MAFAIHLRRAVALIGRHPALAGIDLDVREGTVALLTGPNGAGKTSILRACAGLLSVVEGEAEVLGEDLRRDRRAVRRRVGLLGHASSLYEDLTVAENIRFAVRATGGGKADVAWAMARAGLPDRLTRVAVSRLSAGQRRRVAVASLVARWPELWLLDEPHAGLDAASRHLLDEAILDAAASGATVLVASHEVDNVSRIADSVVSVAGGQVHGVLDGRPLRGPRAPAEPAPAAGEPAGALMLEGPVHVA